MRKNLAEIESGQGNTEVALQIYCDALVDDENDVTLWFNVGDHALKLRRLRLARHAFEQALRCNPSHWPCLSKLCCVLSVLGDDAACVVATRRALYVSCFGFATESGHWCRRKGIPGGLARLRQRKRM